jgi:hypothetical protein
MADERSITRADLLEDMMSGEGFGDGADVQSRKEKVNLSEITDILESALYLKANAGGAIKEKIRKVLTIIYLKNF